MEWKRRHHRLRLSDTLEGIAHDRFDDVHEAQCHASLCFNAVRVAVEAHGGTVVQLLGDGVMCAFGVPHVAEDDALRAVRAAVGIQHAFP